MVHLVVMEPLVVRSRAPLRLGLAGGGSGAWRHRVSVGVGPNTGVTADVSPYCDTYGGAVLNATIDRYASATFESRDDGKVVFASTDLQQSETLDSLAILPLDKGLRLHRGVYNRMIAQYNGGNALSFTLTTHVESPMGSGLV